MTTNNLKLGQQLQNDITELQQKNLTIINQLKKAECSDAFRLSSYNDVARSPAIELTYDIFRDALLAQQNWNNDEISRLQLEFDQL